MSTIDLTILGLLKKKSMSPYDMVRFIDFRGIKTFVKISAPAVYKNMIKLHNKGYLDTEKVKQSEMPEKTVYSITDKGNDYFEDLMRKYAANPGDIIFDFNTFVAFSLLIERTECLDLLDSLKMNLEAKRNAIKEAMSKDYEYEGMPKFPDSGRAIMKQYYRLYKMLSEWVEEYKNKLSSG